MIYNKYIPFLRLIYIIKLSNGKGKLALIEFGFISKYDKTLVIVF